MKKSTRLISIILSCLLLVGAAVGITVAADEAAEGAEISIDGYNLSFEGSVRVAYYVSNRELAEGERVAVITSGEEFTEVPYQLTTDDGYAVCESFDTVETERGTYSVFYSEGVKTVELRRDIYAMAVIVDAAGAVVDNTDVAVYSPYTYAMNRFNGESTDDQYGLYTALLNYGAAVQAVFDYNAEAGKWADEYIVVDQVTTINGTPADTDFVIRGATLEDPTVYEYVAPRWYGEDKNLIFTGFTGADGESYLGETYSANWNKLSLKPGNHTINANYASEVNGGSYVTFDTDVDGNVVGVDNIVSATVTAGEKTTNYTGVTANDKTTVYDYKKVETTKIINSKLVIGKRVEVTAVTSGTGIAKGDIAHAAANQTQFTMQTSTATPVKFENAAVHVMEFDINVKAGNNSGAHLGQFYFANENASDYIWSANLSDVGQKGFWMNIEGYSFESYASNREYIVSEDAPLAYGVDHTLRFELYNDALGEGTVMIKSYVNGKHVQTNYLLRGVINGAPAIEDTDKAHDFSRFKFNLPSGSRNTEIAVDNVYLGTEYKSVDYIGLGKYTNISDTLDMSNVNQMYSSTSAKWTATSAKVVTSADGNPYVNYKHTSNSTLYFKNDGDTAGDTYVQSFDFKWDGSTGELQKYGSNSTTTNARAAAAQMFIGMMSAESGAAPSMYFYRLYMTAINGYEDGDMYITTGGQDINADSDTAAQTYYDWAYAEDGTTWQSSSFKDGAIESLEATLEKGAAAVLKNGQWYNIRVEYTPDGNGREDRFDVVTTTTVTVYDADGNVVGEPTVTTSTKADQWFSSSLGYAVGSVISTDTTETDKDDGTKEVKTVVKKTVNTDTTKTTPEDSRVTGDFKLFINGDLILHNATHRATEGAVGNAAFTNESYGWAFFNARSTDHINGVDYSIDNVYTGAYNGYDYATGNSTSADAKYDSGIDSALTFDDLEGFSVTGVTFGNVNSNDNYVNYNNSWAQIVTEGTNNVLELGNRKPEMAEGALTARFDSQSASGDTYVFDTNLKWLGTSKVTGREPDDRWALKMGLLSSAGSEYLIDGKSTTDNYMVSVYGWVTYDNFLDLYVNSTKNERVYIGTVPYGVWTNLRVAYTLGDPSTDGKSTGTVTVYLDGECKVLDNVAYCHYSFKDKTDINTDLHTAFINVRAYAKDSVLLVDDTYVGAIYTRASENKDAVTFDESDALDKYVYAPNYDYTNNRIEAIDGDNALVIEKNHETNKTQSAIARFYNTSNALGSAYVFESAVRFDSEMSWISEPGDPWSTKLAFDNTAGEVFWQALLAPVFAEDGTVIKYEMRYNSTTSEVMAVIPADTWTKLRIEYVPVTSTTGYALVYVNGAIVYTQDTVATISSKVNTTYRYAYCEQRIYASYASTAFDNVVVGTTDQLVASAELSFDADDTLTYTPNINRDGLLTVTEDGYLNFTVNRYLEDESVNPAWTADTANWRLTFNLPDATVLGHTQLGSVYSMEYKVRINDLKNCADKTTSWWCYSGINATNMTTWTENNASFSSNGLSTSNVIKIHGITVTAGEWISVRQTFRISAVDATTGGYTIQYATYINGTLSSLGTTTHAGNKVLTDDVLCCGFMFRGCNNNNGKMDSINVDFDDIVFSSYNTVVDAPAETPAENQ